jgi:hypothetical protein
MSVFLACGIFAFKPLTTVNGIRERINKRINGNLARFSPEILRGGKSLDVYTDTSLLQPSGDYSNGVVNCGYYEISGYRHAQSMIMRLCGHL